MADTSERPYVLCHMTTSVDGRIKVRRWTTIDADSQYEAVHKRLKGDAWMCGRITMQGYADSAKPLASAPTEEPVSRQDHVARTDAAGYAVALDARGAMDWGARNDIEGDHVIVLTTGQVSDDRLRCLKAGGQSYIIAGEREVDFALALAKLKRLFGIERLLVEGGGRINGSMLKAGLVDELSLLLAPAVDGVIGTPALFDFEGGEGDSMGSRRRLTRTACEPFDDGTVWLRYRIEVVG
ncbi:MAG TPA: RibD family protein [Methylobacterium sp.]|jgi:riboflavin biosynthesis pyrimidine reductase|uniref:dihydrofolate reductase family protein n=1 Tax=Methylorubrum sp. B1-46 TaxID=2897334 RepID=UPI001E5B9B69|nr:RibD family protein [Methylorubrum sp. B1-46]UGB25495.1 RibD family protein [Methylorubrum sp. B1-46]HEV2545073.1 RibD family protein [Methylobacterium sp.]